MTEDEKEFSRLKRKTTKLVNKIENKGIELTDIEISAVSRVGHAESMNDISWLVISEMERIFDKYKIR
ncbi:hypothetical protein ACT8ZR_09170 [Neobacillus sp. M.A.Huq-85]